MREWYLDEQKNLRRQTWRDVAENISQMLEDTFKQGYEVGYLHGKLGVTKSVTRAAEELYGEDYED